MSQPHPIAVQNFSHVCIGVSDVEASRNFYTAVLGMDVVFDVELEGAGLDSLTGGAAQRGRMVGGLIGAAMVELMYLGPVPECPRGPHLGTPTSRFGSTTSTPPTTPFETTILTSGPTRRSTSAQCGCSSSTTPTAPPSNYSSWPPACRPRCNSGDRRAETYSTPLITDVRSGHTDPRRGGRK